MNWIEFEQKLNMKGQKTFTPLDVMRLLNKSEVSVRFFLHRYTKKGALTRLRNGLYILPGKIPSEFEIANKLYSPSYISFEYALSYYKVIPQIVYTVTSATTKPTREFTALDIVYRYSKIKRGLFFGYEPIKKDNTIILMATPEKAFVDYLYFVSLKKRVMGERINIRLLNKHKILSYASKFKKDNLIKIIKGLL